MKTHTCWRFWVLWGLALASLVLTAGCRPVPPVAAEVSPSVTPAPTQGAPTATVTWTPWALPSPTATVTPLPPTPTPCAAEVCVVPADFPLQRPIAPPGDPHMVRYYPFGSTRQGRLEPHHGVEFLNPADTPVRAAAAGEVVFAGWDDRAQLAPWPYYYGQAVVLRHTLPQGDVLYTLYAHLSAISVREGQSVAAGEEVGRVGHTGAALGDHLHFEVRTAAQDFWAVQNPALWLAPLPGTGVLALQLTDAQGRPLYAVVHFIPPTGAPWDAETYADPRFSGHPRWRENLALGDLPPGTYRLEVLAQGRLWQHDVIIQDGSLTVVRWALTP